jgi:tetratricopeptide (TPR) repeat protein
MRAPLVAATLLAGAALAHAEPPRPSVRPPSPLWDELIHPSRARCARVVEDAHRLLEARTSQAREAAVRALSAAAPSCPSSPALHALLGRELVIAGDFAAARSALERARALTPDGADHDAQLAFQLGFVRAMTGDLAGSLAEYRRAEALGGLGDEQWLLEYDLGDDLMALGRLEEAIDRYRRSVRLAPSHESMPRLALAVALERDDQLDRARAELDIALARDAGLRALSSGRFHFLPPGDEHYYRFLALRARGQLLPARRELEAFLIAVPDGPYSARARAHLRALTAASK